MDKFGFGKYRSSIRLYEVLSENPRFIKRVSGKYHKYLMLLKDVCSSNINNKEFVYDLLITHIKCLVDKSKWPNKIKTHFIASVLAHSRKYFKNA